MRGEYLGGGVLGHKQAELPPRARRILSGRCTISKPSGTTSACAENTYQVCSHTYANGNYLRVRGEYPKSPAPANGNGGTTSACAENTTFRRGVATGILNYLRVRGEYVSQLREVREIMELPPRARRILGNTSVEALNNGTTSACAENTLNELGLL